MNLNALIKLANSYFERTARLFKPDEALFNNLKLCLNDAVKRYYTPKINKVKIQSSKIKEQGEAESRALDQVRENIEEIYKNFLNKLGSKIYTTLIQLDLSKPFKITINNSYIVYEFTRDLENAFNIRGPGWCTELKSHDDGIAYIIKNTDCEEYKQYTVEWDGKYFNTSFGTYEKDELLKYWRDPVEYMRSANRWDIDFLLNEDEIIADSQRYVDEYIEDIDTFLSKLNTAFKADSVKDNLISDSAIEYVITLNNKEKLSLVISFYGPYIDEVFKTKHYGLYNTNKYEEDIIHSIRILFDEFVLNFRQKTGHGVILPNLNINSNELKEAENTLWHELVHLEQRRHGLTRGLPPKDKTKKFDMHGVDPKTRSRTEEHAFRDIEAYPRLNDTVREFEEGLKEIGQKIRYSYVQKENSDYLALPIEKQRQLLLAAERKYLKDFIEGGGHFFHKLLRGDQKIKEPQVSDPTVQKSDSTPPPKEQTEDPTRIRYKQMVKKFLLWVRQHHPEIMG